MNETESERDRQLHIWRNALGPTRKELEAAEQWMDSLRPPEETVKMIQRGNWHMDDDGRVESRMDIGQSDKGFHYRIDQTDNHTFDRAGSWSEPLKTQELAKYTGFTEIDGTGHTMNETEKHREQEAAFWQRTMDQGREAVARRQEQGLEPKPDEDAPKQQQRMSGT